mmetsp:Transcript_4735/g.5967  ORF Transcript_4735/g.5967 Transcript_4735/m.5967 type:complete len:216 (-) Transcript_4735:684-1331(-)
MFFRGTKASGDQTLLSWTKRLEESIQATKKATGWNYVQMATCGPDMHPTNRTVVFRGFKKCVGTKRRCLKFVTDSRSEKVKNLSSNPYSEVAWWFPGTSEQYRISGKVDIISADETDKENIDLRVKQWGEMSNHGRQAFYYPPGGLVIKDKDEELLKPKAPKGGRDGKGFILPPPDTFVVLLLWTDTIKYLNLKENFAQVDKHTDTSWTSERVTP